MTRQEAIEWFKMMKENFDNTKYADALNMAIDALAQDKVLCLGDLESKCKHCTVKGETTHYCYCDWWNSAVDPCGWCNYGEREEKEAEE